MIHAVQQISQPGNPFLTDLRPNRWLMFRISGKSPVSDLWHKDPENQTWREDEWGADRMTRWTRSLHPWGGLESQVIRWLRFPTWVLNSSTIYTLISNITLYIWWTNLWMVQDCFRKCEYEPRWGKCEVRGRGMVLPSAVPERPSTLKLLVLFFLRCFFRLAWGDGGGSILGLVVLEILGLEQTESTRFGSANSKKQNQDQYEEQLKL